MFHDGRNYTAIKLELLQFLASTSQYLTTIGSASDRDTDITVSELNHFWHIYVQRSLAVDKLETGWRLASLHRPTSIHDSSESMRLNFECGETLRIEFIEVYWSLTAYYFTCFYTSVTDRRTDIQTNSENCAGCMVIKIIIIRLISRLQWVICVISIAPRPPTTPLHCTVRLLILYTAAAS